MTNGKKIFLETSPTGMDAKQERAKQNEVKKRPAPRGFLPQDARVDIGEGNNKLLTAFSGKKPLGEGHVFMPGVI